MALIRLVNTSVLSDNKTLLPWSIIRLNNESHTIEEFYKECVEFRLEGANFQISSAYVGHDRNILDFVELSLPILSVVSSFGLYLRYLVVSCSPDVAPVATYITSSEQSSSQLLQSYFVKERTKKDKILNDIINFLQSKSVNFEESEFEDGKQLLLLLRDIFWYIDGHHHVFEQRAKEIPPIFSFLVGYNLPHLSKHRKRQTMNISSQQLQDYSLKLSTLLLKPYWERPPWPLLKSHFCDLMQSLSSYAEYLCRKNKYMKSNHRSPTPIRDVADNIHLKFLEPCDDAYSLMPPVKVLNDILFEKEEYVCTSINHLIPSDPVAKHRFINMLQSSGLSFPAMLLVYAPGSNVGNLHFMWKTSAEANPSDCFEKSQHAVEQAKKEIPIYHTRSMKRAMFRKFGLISSDVKPGVLRYFYHELTGDQSSSDTTQQSCIDKRIRQIIDMEDSEVILDLRSENRGHVSKYDSFWIECEKFLSEDIGLAVDDRRHDHVTHLAHAISILDLVEQVRARCPEGALIPSEEWVRLQFWPKTPSSKSSLHHTGKFKMKFMIQQRQWRKDHEDSHYAAALFQYMCE
jgi:hypothetical protein